MQILTLTETRSRRLSPAALRRLTGAAGLGYVVAAGIENMELLRAPLSGATAAEVRALYADQALQVVTTAAGALSLLLYCVFALCLAGRVRAGRVVAAAGLGGPLLAAVGVAAHVAMIGEASVDLYALELDARFVAGGLMALFLAGVGRAALRSGALPRPLARLAIAAAVPLSLGPVAAVTGAHALEPAVVIAFGGHALWIAAASLWLTAGGDGVGARELARRVAFLLLVVAAGLVGIALLAVPGATGSFFAWRLEPSPLAAFAGGVYVGSAAVYAAGLRRRDRSLDMAAAVLSVSVLAITVAHLDVFDFGRLQAWAWVALFGAFAATTCVLAVTGRTVPRAGDRLAGWARGALAAVALLLAALGVALWIDPAALAAPFALPPLGGRFAGSWVVMLAVLAGWAALRDRRDEARLPALALVALPAGALVAAARTGELDAGYVAALALLGAVGLAVGRSVMPPR